MVVPRSALIAQRGLRSISDLCTWNKSDVNTIFVSLYYTEQPYFLLESRVKWSFNESHIYEKPGLSDGSQNDMIVNGQ